MPDNEERRKYYDDIADTIDNEKKRLKEERKQLQKEQKEQRKEAKKRAKELAKQEAEIDDEVEGSSVPVVLITLFIVLIWIAILCILIKLDVGGFGSGVLRPVLKDVPVLNQILPGETASSTSGGDDEQEEYYGYKSLKEAVEQIKVLELELEKAQTTGAADSEEVAALKAEVERLKTFEDNQVEFQRIKNEFYEEVVYAEKGPGAEAYRKYYEEIDPTTAEMLYKQVVQQLEEDQKITDYASAYSAMKPAAAAKIFEEMKNDLDLAAKILNAMSAEDRGKILGVMEAETAAKLTKIMDPDS